MKKLTAMILSLSLLLALAGCGSQTPSVIEPPETTVATEAPKTTAATEPEQVKELVIDDEVKAELDAILSKHKYHGVVYLTHKGQEVYTYANGNDDMGQPLTVDSHMLLSCTSKQFCATAVLILADQGKLRLEDRLTQYFPEYTIGKDITIRQLLSMRSGVVPNIDPMWEEPEKYADDTPEQIDELMKEWVFSQNLLFEPGTSFAYGNTGYNLLSWIVEQVSGQSYEDFVRKNIFEPLGMDRTGFLLEMADHPEWGLIDETILGSPVLGELSQGTADIISNAKDLDIWMTALPGGLLIRRESYEEMAAFHTAPTLTGMGFGYGYGLMGTLRDGRGHSGRYLDHSSALYSNEDYDFRLFAASNDTDLFDQGLTDTVVDEIQRALFKAADAAGAS